MTPSMPSNHDEAAFSGTAFRYLNSKLRSPNRRWTHSSHAQAWDHPLLGLERVESLVGALKTLNSCDKLRMVNVDQHTEFVQLAQDEYAVRGN